MSIYKQYMYSYPHKLAYGALENINLRDYKHHIGGSLYFHIPFCEGKCGYCNLFSLAGQKNDLVERYIVKMEEQVTQYLKCFNEGDITPEFTDLVLGGGTPLYLSSEQLQRIFDMASRLGFKGNNIIVETSPKQTTPEKLEILKKNGVTRLSMGIQSFFDIELKNLNRIHYRKDIETALSYIKETGFECVNLDIIYGIPGQSIESLKESIDLALSYDPNELFVYPLYVKKDTYLWVKGVEQNPLAEEMYRFIRPYLKEKGYEGLSMRRFVKESVAENCIKRGESCGFESTLSIGCGGRSYLGNLHFCTPYFVKQSECMLQLQKYLEKEDFCSIDHGYILDEEEMKRRYVIKNILFATGISFDEYLQLFNGELLLDFPEIGKWIEDGLAVSDENRIRLTEEGIIQSDNIGPILMSKKVVEKMGEKYVRESIDC